jgi:hypothetical protein
VGQKIKYPYKFLEQNKRIDIEGAFLFASILESIGLDVV